jgi:hypothetical protein
MQGQLSSPPPTASAVCGFRLHVALTGRERSPEDGVWFTRAGNGVSHPSSPVLTVDFVSLLYFWAFLYFLFLLYIFSLYFSILVTHDVWVLWNPYTSFTTFTGGFDSSHPCPELMGPHLRKYCPRVLTFLAFYLYFLVYFLVFIYIQLGCPALVDVIYFQSIY